MTKAKDWLIKDKLEQVGAWAAAGLIDKQIAANMGIAVSTLCEWKNKYPEFLEALKAGKDVADKEVENALYKRAKGYRYKEITRRLDKDTGQMVVVQEVEKEALPDTTAQIYWLKNRQPDLWRDKRETAITGDVSCAAQVAAKETLCLDFDGLSEAALLEIAGWADMKGVMLKDAKDDNE